MFTSSVWNKFLNVKRNRVLVINFDFLIPISLQPGDENL